MENELELVGPRKSERWHELDTKDYVYQALEDMVDGDPRGIDWHKLMMQMPSDIWFQAQNMVKTYIRNQRELIHRQLDDEMKKSRRMPYREKQAHFIQFNG